MRLRPLAAHVAFKAVQRLRHYTDAMGGWRLRTRRERRWAAAWAARHASIGEWLERPGAGRFWMSVAGGRRWAAARCSDADLTVARGVVAGRLSLLGCSDARIGAPPQWRRDLYSGAEWPLRSAGSMPLVLAPGSDIRTIWELSRCYHFALLAKAYWRTGEPAFVDAFRSHVESWLEQNPAGLGPNWRSPMDAGIRAANWILAALLFADAPGLSPEFWGNLLANLRLTGWFIQRHLEWHPRSRGNHFVADAVGLVYLGALFADDALGHRWLETGGRLLEEEMEFQVRPDGGSFEAALGYHRLLTELFSFGGEICRRNPRVAPKQPYWTRLARMHWFMACYLPENGEAPMLGDADDGRLHMLCAEALQYPRRHRVGLRARQWPRKAPESAAFPEAGFFVLRGDHGHAVLRCGPVGLNGAGSHDHNDQLSLELVVAGCRIIADSGTFTYTRDLVERFAFRSTAAHSVPQLGDEEQNPIVPERPWRVLADRTRAQCVEWTASPDLVRFVGRHFGYAHRPSGAVCWRTVQTVPALGTWQVRDRLEGTGVEALTWRLHFAPGTLELRSAAPGQWTLVHSAAPSLRISLQGDPGLDAEVISTRMSERYGQAVPRPAVVLRGNVSLPVEVSLELRPG